MAEEIFRDFAAWTELVWAVAGNVTVVATGFAAIKFGLPRLKRIADANERRAAAVENAAILAAVDSKVQTGETLATASARVRAQLIFEAYQEWRGEQHLAAGGAAALAQGEVYFDWLRRALHLLEVVLIQAARAGNDDHWLATVKSEMANHSGGLARLDENGFSLGKVRELIRNAKVRDSK